MQHQTDQSSTAMQYLSLPNDTAALMFPISLSTTRMPNLRLPRLMLYSILPETPSTKKLTTSPQERGSLVPIDVRHAPPRTTWESLQEIAKHSASVSCAMQ
mmetsp:Transcript_9323/g.34510  ORF Transcript_9323/g.34510 Transcript_9323/m.34510 type:complete len:101 (-) Transcript_9323:1632-1934(-)